MLKRLRQYLHDLSGRLECLLGMHHPIVHQTTGNIVRQGCKRCLCSLNVNRVLVLSRRRRDK